MNWITALRGIGMSRSPVDITYDLIRGLEGNYPDWPSTFGPCWTDNCSNGARGAGLCADCYEVELCKAIGPTLSQELHDAIRSRHTVWYDIKQMLKDKHEE